jgi:hypothetical protein
MVPTGAAPPNPSLARLISQLHLSTPALVSLPRPASPVAAKTAAAKEDDGKVMASVLLERLPVVIPKIHPVIYAFQEFSYARSAGPLLVSLASYDLVSFGLFGCMWFRFASLLGFGGGSSTSGSTLMRSLAKPMLGDFFLSCQRLYLYIPPPFLLV